MTDTCAKIDRDALPEMYGDCRKVWIGCLAAYNEGHLHGEWVNTEGMDEADLRDAIKVILAASPAYYAEEPLFADYEGYAPALFYGSEPTFDEIIKAEEFYDRLESDAGAYYGEYASERDFAINYLEETNMLRNEYGMSTLISYFDYDAYWDCELRHDFYAVEVYGGVLIFYRN